MANFVPLKNRFLLELDNCLDFFKSPGHFLDYGCGKADVALHMIQKHQWSGDLLEVDATSRAQIKENPLLESCEIFSSSTEIKSDSYDLILIFDVLEHLEEPEKVLLELNRMLKPGGCLALIIPYRQKTWGWDDDHYGHLRRWESTELVSALEEAKFNVIQISDPTYPLYRFLRWAMLKKQKPPTNMYEGDNFTETMSKRSEMSPHNNAWQAPPWWTKHLPWNILNYMTLPFNKILKGDEVFAFANKTIIQEHGGDVK